jgi:hypothetical protein
VALGVRMMRVARGVGRWATLCLCMFVVPRAWAQRVKS